VKIATSVLLKLIIDANKDYQPTNAFKRIRGTLFQLLKTYNLFSRQIQLHVLIVDGKMKLKGIKL